MARQWDCLFAVVIVVNQYIPKVYIAIIVDTDWSGNECELRSIEGIFYRLCFYVLSL